MGFDCFCWTCSFGLWVLYPSLRLTSSFGSILVPSTDIVGILLWKPRSSWVESLWWLLTTWDPVNGKAYDYNRNEVALT